MKEFIKIEVLPGSVPFLWNVSFQIHRLLQTFFVLLPSVNIKSRWWWCRVRNTMKRRKQSRNQSPRKCHKCHKYAYMQAEMWVIFCDSFPGVMSAIEFFFLAVLFAEPNGNTWSSLWAKGDREWESEEGARGAQTRAAAHQEWGKLAILVLWCVWTYCSSFSPAMYLCCLLISVAYSAFPAKTFPPRSSFLRLRDA